ncbi:carbohydrate kinase family protein [Amnibacterium sp.]|uniref:carbohydrate kinase family protein n=1 Tax=Amnibacterium sp. TaxID=1872496 RepID=UPI00261BB1AD|nr:PfkB family carbohydrate kinase [Amnibacterium sp.]MCU1474723.1 rbsK 1 [Amnibacterium sp.]
MIEPRVLVVGDVIDDVLVRPSGPIRFGTDTPSTIARLAGGSAANTACWIAASGVAATVVATVHHEDVARHAALLERAGVAPELAGADEPTGTIVVLSDGGERTMLTSRGANVLTGPDAVRPELLGAHTLLHLTGHVVTGPDRDAGWRDLFALAARLRVPVSVDPGSVGLLAEYGARRFRSLIAGCDLLLPSREEAGILTGESDPERAALALAEHHRTVVVKCGAAGAVAVSDGRVIVTPAAPSTPVDVTGAGDAFAGALLASLARGVPLVGALDSAAERAAEAVGILGARPA